MRCLRAVAACFVCMFGPTKIDPHRQPAWDDLVCRTDRRWLAALEGFSATFRYAETTAARHGHRRPMGCFPTAQALSGIA